MAAPYYCDFCSIFFRACGAARICMLFFFAPEAQMPVLSWFFIFFSVMRRDLWPPLLSWFFLNFGHACVVARIFKANCAAAFTIVILALFLLASFGSTCDDAVLLYFYLKIFSRLRRGKIFLVLQKNVTFCHFCRPPAPPLPSLSVTFADPPP